MTLTLPSELDIYLTKIATSWDMEPSDIMEALVRHEIERVLGIETDPKTQDDMELPPIRERSEKAGKLDDSTTRQAGIGPRQTRGGVGHDFR